MNRKRIVSKRIINLLGILALQVVQAFAQISEGGVPPSFQYQPTTRSAVATQHIPVDFYVDDLKHVDEWQASQGAPPAVATLIDVALNPQNAGAWSVLPSGEKIWQLNLRAEGALAVMLYYSDFYIPEGGKLFLYNAEKSQLLGAYTHRSHPSGGRFATEFVTGDDLTLEYVSAPDDERLRIEIEAIGYGYNHLFAGENSVSLRAVSSSCEVNINCEEGDMWQRQKKGVCHTIQRVGSKSYICSAALVNNTAQDLKPYILTAQHCSSDGTATATAEEMEQWVFYFNYELSGCSNQSVAVPASTMTGCTKMASTATNGESDGLLLLINTPIPPEYNVYYNGWDRRDKPSQTGAGLHCPAGDYMKISTYKNPISSFTFRTEGNIAGDANGHWNAVFDETPNGHGITEKGSSGSPLFNESKLIIGTLTGGSSTCEAPTGLNLYGKLNYHWDKYKSRMSDWLDPVGSGVETLQGRYSTGEMIAPTNLRASYQNKVTQLTWSAPYPSPLKYCVYDNDVKIGESRTLSYAAEAPEAGAHVYSVSAVYTGERESGVVNASILVPEYKAPINVSAVYTVSQKVAILWDAPVYEQTIYWGGIHVMTQLIMDDNQLFYFGQLWTASDILPFHRKTLSTVKFLPIRNNTYEIYITQGSRTYSQKIDNPIYGTLNTIPLTTPFIIDGTQTLIVSIYVSKLSIRSSEYPAACDGGPAIQGKGNVFSLDGKTWKTLADVNEGEEAIDVNFFIAAQITSVEGDLPLSSRAGEQPEVVLSNAGADPLRIASSSSALPAEKVSLRSLSPSAFPEITGYTIYRNQVKIASVAISPRRYIDLNPLAVNSYQVAAMFGNNEGLLSAPTEDISSVGNMEVEANGIALYPSVFGDQVEIKGVDQVERVEVYGIDGKRFLRVEHPDKVIQTQSLPAGIYFFKIYPCNDTPKVLRGVKRGGS
jgi:hypothetical protein